MKRQELSERARPVRDNELLRVRRPDGAVSFYEALRRPEGLAVIAEIKRRSPSAGTIAEGIDAAEQARIYYNAKADAVSVLTDSQFFGGSIHDLWDVNDLLAPRADGPPTLRKDFFVHPLQVLEAAEAGAAAILLIVRALEDAEMRLLFDAAKTANIDALFEVHSEPELDRALAAGARVIGVNNRDLTRFVTDLALSEALIPKIPDSAAAISESGIWTIEDAMRARAAGADAILVGEALMKMEDPAPFIRDCHEL